MRISDASEKMTKLIYFLKLGGIKMSKVLIIVAVLALSLGSYASMAKAGGSGHFHCSTCGSHNHGSLWHDSNKDGTNDR